MMILSAALILATLTSPGPADNLRQAAGTHGIDFGTAVDPRFFAEPAYASILASQFSVIEPENAMKFASIHPRPGSAPASYSFEDADKIVSFAQANHLKIRGHTLVWHNQNPSWITDGELTSGGLRQAMDGHIRTVVGRYRGKVYAWDVVNEAFDDKGGLRSTVWYDKPGIGLAGKGTAYIEHAFEEAHAADPEAKLFYNDYGAETLGPKADAIYAMAKDFKSRHVPLDGIGFQSHLIMQMDNAQALDSIRKNLERFSELGLDIHITELDIRVPDSKPDTLKRQADFYRKFVAICSSIPRCKLIQTWGFTDKHSWIPMVFRGMGWALLWDDSYQPKPSYYAVLSALQGKR